MDFLLEALTNWLKEMLELFAFHFTTETTMPGVMLLP